MAINMATWFSNNSLQFISQIYIYTRLRISWLPAMISASRACLNCVLLCTEVRCTWTFGNTQRKMCSGVEYGDLADQLIWLYFPINELGNISSKGKQVLHVMWGARNAEKRILWEFSSFWPEARLQSLIILKVF